jgi:hypothetical protein
MPKIKICKQEGCHNAQTTAGYCRLHYLSNWKKIKQEHQERAAKRLNRYIESVVKQHPKKYIEVIKDDINSGKIKPRDEINDMDDLCRLFSEPTYEEEIEQLIKDLKIEKDF